MHNRDLALGAGLAGDAVPRHQLAGLLRDYRLAAVDSAEYGYSEAQAGSLHGLLQLATAAPGWRYR
jgi:hypothetical protein